MNEIKTCEEYVVAKLQAAEEKIKELEHDNLMLGTCINNWQRLIKVIAQKASVKKSFVIENEHLITFENIWEDSTPEFDKLCELLGLKKEEEKKEEESAE